MIIKVIALDVEVEKTLPTSTSTHIVVFRKHFAECLETSGWFVKAARVWFTERNCTSYAGASLRGDFIHCQRVECGHHDDPPLTEGRSGEAR